jgi:hypothetical protein
VKRRFARWYKCYRWLVWYLSDGVGNAGRWKRGQCALAPPDAFDVIVLINSSVLFEVFTAVVMKSIIFWDMMPCSPLSEQAGGWFAELILRPWRWRRYVPPKRRVQLNGLHGVISQKMILSSVLVQNVRNAAVATRRFWCWCNPGLNLWHEHWLVYTVTHISRPRAAVMFHCGVEVHQFVYCIIPLGDQFPKNDTLIRKWSGWLNLQLFTSNYALPTPSGSHVPMEWRVLRMRVEEIASEYGR